MRRKKRSSSAVAVKRRWRGAVTDFPARPFRTGNGIVRAAVGADGAVMAARSATSWATEWEPSGADLVRLCTGIEEVPRGQTARVPGGWDLWWGPCGTFVTVCQAAWHNARDGAADQWHVSGEGLRKKIC